MNDTPRTDEAKDLQRKGLYLLCCTLERELAVMKERFKMMDKSSAANYDCAKELERKLSAVRELADEMERTGRQGDAERLRAILGSASPNS